MFDEYADYDFRVSPGLPSRRCRPLRSTPVTYVSQVCRENWSHDGPEKPAMRMLVHRLNAIDQIIGLMRFTAG